MGAVLVVFFVTFTSHTDGSFDRASITRSALVTTTTGKAYVVGALYDNNEIAHPNPCLEFL